MKNSSHPIMVAVEGTALLSGQQTMIPAFSPQFLRLSFQDRGIAVDQKHIFFKVIVYNQIENSFRTSWRFSVCCRKQAASGLPTEGRTKRSRIGDNFWIGSWWIFRTPHKQCLHHNIVYKSTLIKKKENLQAEARVFKNIDSVKEEVKVSSLV